MAVYSFIGYAPTALTYDSGSGTWTLDPAFDHTEDRVVIEITDNDSIFNGDSSSNEIGSDTSQTGVVTQPDGTPIASGQIYDEEFYEILNPSGGAIWIERVEIGGQFVGYMVSEELTPGTAYTEVFRTNVSPEDDSEESYNTWTSVPCYVAGTKIETEHGTTAIEDVVPGMLVLTYDNGLVPVVWAGKRHISMAMQAQDPSLKPIRISAGALGDGIPSKVLRVSPQHRIFFSDRARRTEATKIDVFAPAKGLVNLRGIHHLDDGGPITYHHILCENHQIIKANGAWSETLFPGKMVFQMLGPVAAAEVRQCLGSAMLDYQLARPCLTVREALREFTKPKKVLRNVPRSTTRSEPGPHAQAGKNMPISRPIHV